MSYCKKIFLLWIFSFIAPLASQETSPPASSQALKYAMVSIYAVDTKTNRVLIDENSSLSLLPASCIKLVTTAAALHLLGPNYRFETELQYQGSIDSSKTLHGNLYLQGGGDPCLGSDRIEHTLSWEEQIEKWAQAIEKAGIRKIKGKILADTSRWEKALAVPSWLWEDLGNYYGAGACALSFHENAYRLFFKPGKKISEKAQILYTDPPLFDLTVHSEVVTGAEGSEDFACIYGTEFCQTQFIRGTIPMGKPEFMIQGAIPDPANLTVNLLVKALEKRGIQVEGDDLNLKNPRILLDTTYSPKVEEIVYWTNQKSINLYAEHLLKKMGEISFEEGSTTLGTRAVREFWQSRQIDLGGCHIADGSGLSRKNLVTTKMLVQVLLEMKKSDLYPLFLKSLPAGKYGEKAKSGSMSQTRGYAGYIDDITFAILINQCESSNAMKEKIEDLLKTLKKDPT